jgi:hypothetical protein
MPFFLIPSALGVCFCLIWVFIGGMIYRDAQLAAQRDRESEMALQPLARYHAVPRPKAVQRRAKRAQFAS